MTDDAGADPNEARRVSLLDRILGRTPRGAPELTQMLETKTDEGIQEMAPRARTTRRELGVESGSVLRLPEGVDLDRADLDVEAPEDETMILNLGPSHPSTHGVLRVMVEMDGETVLRSKPVIGYLHTGMEKTAEELMYHQGSTNVTRMDYLSPVLQRARLLLERREAAGPGDAAPGHMDPDAHVRAQPDQLALPVAGHQRRRHRRHQHARLRVA